MPEAPLIVHDSARPKDHPGEWCRVPDTNIEQHELVYQDWLLRVWCIGGEWAGASYWQYQILLGEMLDVTDDLDAPEDVQDALRQSMGKLDDLIYKLSLDCKAGRQLRQLPEEDRRYYVDPGGLEDVENPDDLEWLIQDRQGGTAAICRTEYMAHLVLDQVQCEVDLDEEEDDA